MTTTSSPASRESVRVATVLAGLVGLLIVGYGLLVVSESLLGGVWVAAVGLSLLLSALVSTHRVGDRLGLSAAGRRRLSLALAVLALGLFVAFVVVNGATFESGELAGRSGSAGGTGSA